MTAWSDEDDSNDDEEIVNLCLMANEEESEVSSNSNDLNSSFFDELQDAYNELYLEFETKNSKYKKLI